MWHKCVETVCAFGVLCLVAASTFGQDLDVSWYTVDGGGGMGTSGGTFELSGTIGQPDGGGMAMSGGTFALSGGFWPAVRRTPAIPGDCDGDGDVDLEDYVSFEACLIGPGRGLGAGCDCFDSDADGDVTLSDFAEFQDNFGHW